MPGTRASVYSCGCLNMSGARFIFKGMGPPRVLLCMFVYPDSTLEATEVEKPPG